MENPLSKVLTSAPPPPPAEVKIRTMRSDIESMRRSGGGPATFQSVAVSGLSIERGGPQAPIADRTPMPTPASFSIPTAPVVRAPAESSIPAQAPAMQPAPRSAPATGFTPSSDVADTIPPTGQEFVPEAVAESHLVPILMVTLVALVAIGVVGYFAYVLFK